jgi:hypothetical protein
MGFKRDHAPTGKAVSLLATCVVVLGGVATCVFIAIFSGEATHRPLMIAGACFLGIVLLLRLLSDRRPTNHQATRWGWLSRRRRRTVEYRLPTRLRATAPPSRPQAPPSVETVRDLAGGLNTWVPLRGQGTKPSEGNVSKAGATDGG